MTKELDPTIKKFLAGIGRKGGRSRARMHSPEELSKWASKGGHPRILTDAKLKRIRKLREQDYTLAEIADKLGVSLATVQRATKLEGE